MDLKTFLLARIEEDDEAARAAVDKDGRWHVDRSHPLYESVVQGDIHIYDEGGHTAEQAAHIARHDPARVLAECAAKRAIVELHSKTTYSLPITQGDDSLEYWHNHTDLVEVRENGHLVEQITTAEWLERVGAVLNPPADELRALAAVYADHADYREGWAA